MTRWVRIAVHLASLLALAPGSAAAAWMVESATLADGRTSLWTAIDASEPPRSGLGTEMPGRLIVACARPSTTDAPGTLEVRLSWRPPVRLATQVPVRYRVDGRAPVETHWTPEPTGDGVSRAGADAADLVAALGRGGTTTIEVDTVAYGRLAWTLGTGRARPALRQVMTHCVGRSPHEGNLTLGALATEWREAARAAAEREARAHEARLAALREGQARIREAAAVRERALADYAEGARREIAGFWVVPEGAGAHSGAIRVAITVDRAGRVLSAALETPSDDAALDWSVVSALDKTREGGLSPLPDSYPGTRLDLVVTLDPGAP